MTCTNVKNSMILNWIIVFSKLVLNKMMSFGVEHVDVMILWSSLNFLNHICIELERIYNTITLLDHSLNFLMKRKYRT